MATIRHYILPPDQFERLREAGGPLADRDVYPSLARLAQMVCPVVEVDGQIVAYWILWQALHAEPLWVHEDHRQASGVARGLVEEVFRAIAAAGEQTAFSVVEEAGLAVIGPYAARLGFQEAPGRLFYIVLTTPEPSAPPEEGA